MKVQQCRYVMVYDQLGIYTYTYYSNILNVGLCLLDCYENLSSLYNMKTITVSHQKAIHFTISLISPASFYLATKTSSHLASQLDFFFSIIKSLPVQLARSKEQFHQVTFQPILLQETTKFLLCCCTYRSQLPRQAVN